MDTENSFGQNLNEMKERLSQVDAHNQSLLQEVDRLKREGQTSKAQIESFQKTAPAAGEEVAKLSTKLLDTEAQLSQTQSSMKELLAQVEQKNKEIQVPLHLNSNRDLRHKYIQIS